MSDSVSKFMDNEDVKYTFTFKEDNKYKVKCKGIEIDVYDVIHAFNVKNAGIQHAIKKLLKGGQRGFKNTEKDYQEAIKSIERAIELERDFKNDI